MVKLATNMSDKLERKPSLDDGFDVIPLITPLEVNQLQQSYADKVIVRTTTQYQLQQQKKKKLYVPCNERVNINLYSDASQKAKATFLTIIMLVFMTSLLVLLLHKTMWYNLLTCPEGFVLKQSHCAPAGLEMYYTDTEQQQQQQQEEAGARSGTGLYAALSHLSQIKRAGPELTSPWLPIISALKEAEMVNKGNEQLEGGLQKEE